VAPILAALWLLTFASTSQVLIVAPLLPAIARELSVSEAQGGWLIGAYGAVACLVALVTGPISDRVGRRAVLVVGSLAMALALWAHLLATSFPALLVARSVAGGAGGVLAGAAVAYVGDYFPYARRGWANGWVMSGLALGQVVGIPLGTVLAKRYGFHAPFLGLAAVTTAAFALVLVAVPQPDVPRSPSVGLARAIRGYSALIRRAPTAAMAGSYALTFLGMASFVAMLPTWLGDRFGADEDDVALLFATGGLAAVITNPIAGRLSDRLGRKVFIVGACATFGVVALVAPHADADFRLVRGLFVVGMMAGAARTPAQQALVSAIVPPEERGALLSLGSALGQGGFAVGGMLAGALYGSTGFAGCAAITAVSMFATAGVVAALVPEPRSSRITQP
jgi:predicted MFS family arabinose efflux permease